MKQRIGWLIVPSVLAMGIIAGCGRPAPLEPKVAPAGLASAVLSVPGMT